MLINLRDPRLLAGLTKLDGGIETEDALLRVAESLLEQGGPDAVTTRAVCDAANVGAPTLYHHYGDKNGLLDALVAKGVNAFLKRKQAVPETTDARFDLVSGWESFVEFALERPQLFRLMVQRVGDNPQILDAAMATTDGRPLSPGCDAKRTCSHQKPLT